MSNKAEENMSQNETKNYEEEFQEILETLIGKTVSSVSFKIDDTDGVPDGIDAISVTTTDGVVITVCIDWETLSLKIYDDKELGGVIK